MPLAILFSVGAGWGISVSLIKFAVTHGIRPFGYLFWVAFGAGLIGLAISAARGRPPRLSRAHLRYYFLIGGLRLAGANAIWYTVVERIPVGVMSVILGTAPIFTYSMSLSLRMERFAATRLVGIVLGLAGVVLFLAPRNSLPEPSMAGWVALGLAAPILYSVANIVIARSRPTDSDSLALAVGMLGAASLMVLTLAAATGQVHYLWPPITWAEAVMMMHMVISALGFLGMFELIRIAGPTFASQLTYIVTLAGVLFGIIMFGEVHSLWVWAATASVLGGVALVNVRPAPPEAV